MINPSQAAADAMTALTRKIISESEINLVDPDITYNGATANGQHSQSKPEQVYNHVLQAHGKYSTCERGRAVTNGTYDIFPDSPEDTEGELGIICNTQSDFGGRFTGSTWVQLNVSNLSLLQTASVCFSNLPGDGYGVDFTLEVYSGSLLAHSQDITDNRSHIVEFGGFLVYDVTAIRIVLSRWSLPFRYARCIEIIPGLYAVWDRSMIYSIDIKEEVDMSCMTCPYDTATLDLRNKDGKFDPRNKSSLFAAIEDRQDIPLRIGPRLSDGSAELLPAGTWYQKDGGWELPDNAGLFIRFKLVSIIGLFAERVFKIPAIVPTTVRGWVEAILAQLGENFVSRYIIDDNLGDVSLTCSAADALNIKCGDVLRYVCMAIGAFPRTDKTTGYLRISKPALSGGITTTRSELSIPAKPKANQEVASLTFRINDGSGSTLTIGGTKTASNKFQSTVCRTRNRLHAA